MTDLKVLFANPADVTVPELSAPVWRYMREWKFRDLVETQSLYFSRVDRFEDEFEGIPPRKVTEALKRLSAVASSTGMGSNVNHILADREKYKRFFYANCWHVRDDESEEMWSAYVGDNCGVAIQTSYVGLLAAVSPPFRRFLQFGLVQYLDYDLQTYSTLGPLEPYFHKRSKYAGEAELRILLQHFPREVYSAKAWAALETAELIGGTVNLMPPELNLDIETLDHIRVPVRLADLFRTLIVNSCSSEDFQAYVVAIAEAADARAMRSRWA